MAPFVRGAASTVRKRVCPGQIACPVKGSSEGCNSMHGLGLARWDLWLFINAGVGAHTQIAAATRDLTRARAS